MNKFIKLPLVERWSYRSRPSDSQPILAKNGILINLDRVTQIHPRSEFHTVLDGNSIPCSLDAIQRAWELCAKPITEIQHDEPFLPYHPWWEGKFEHQTLES